MRYEDIAGMYRAEKTKTEVERIQGAWARRLPETPCPFRYQDGKMLIRHRDGSWEVEWSEDAATICQGGIVPGQVRLGHEG